MTKPAPNRIKKLRALRGLSQADLAASVRAHWVTISKLERGKQQLTQDWIERLAKALRVDPIEIISASSASEIDIVAFIDKAGHVEMLNDDDSMLSDIIEKYKNDAEGDGITKIECIFSNNTFYPYFRSGDVVVFSFGKSISPEICNSRFSMIIFVEESINAFSDAPRQSVFASVGFPRFNDDASRVMIDLPAQEPHPPRPFAAVGVASRVELTRSPLLGVPPLGLRKQT